MQSKESENLLSNMPSRMGVRAQPKHTPNTCSAHHTVSSCLSHSTANDSSPASRWPCRHPCANWKRSRGVRGAASFTVPAACTATAVRAGQGGVCEECLKDTTKAQDVNYI